MSTALQEELTSDKDAGFACLHEILTRDWSCEASEIAEKHGLLVERPITAEEIAASESILEAGNDPGDLWLMPAGAYAEWLAAKGGGAALEGKP